MTRMARARQMPNWVLGLIILAVLAIATIIAFSGLLGMRMPWQGGYEVKVVFENAQNVRRDSPVRIAGVNVGTVTNVEAIGSAEGGDSDEGSTDTASASSGTQAAVVTMDLTDEALPLKTDAMFKLRPRLFLEGNNFIDVKPGSPGAEEIEEGHTFPVNQSSYSVQLDQVLTTLQSDVRANLRLFLDQFGNALIKEGGAAGFREFYRTSGPAGKYMSQVNEALLGTEDGDLGGVIRGLGRVARGLGRNEATLANLVSDFATVSGSFAAEDVALGQAIERLPGVLEAADPAFANLNAAFPPLRAFAREALPGVETTADTLRETTPFISQLRRLMSQSELRGLVADLRPTIPDLANLTQETIPFTEEARALSSCFNEVIIPWANDEVEAVNDGNLYPHENIGRVFEETGYLLSGLLGFGRSGDANGQWARVLGLSGQNLVDLGEDFSLIPYEFLGGMPAIGSSKKTVFTDDNPCERQEPPSLQSGPGPGRSSEPLQQSAAASVGDDSQAFLDRLTDSLRTLNEAGPGNKRALQRSERMLGRMGFSPAEAQTWAGLAEGEG